MANGAILTAEQERKLRQPIDEYVGKIQKEIDELREHGTAEVIEYQNLIANVKRDKTLSKGEKESEIKEFEAKLSQAKAVEAAGIPANARPEQLSMEEFLRLAEKLGEIRN